MRNLLLKICLLLFVTMQQTNITGQQVVMFNPSKVFSVSNQYSNGNFEVLVPDSSLTISFRFDSVIQNATFYGFQIYVLIWSIEKTSHEELKIAMNFQATTQFLSCGDLPMNGPFEMGMASLPSNHTSSERIGYLYLQSEFIFKKAWIKIGVSQNEDTVNVYGLGINTQVKAYPAGEGECIFTDINDLKPSLGYLYKADRFLHFNNLQLNSTVHVFDNIGREIHTYRVKYANDRTQLPDNFSGDLIIVKYVDSSGNLKAVKLK